MIWNDEVLVLGDESFGKIKGARARLTVVF
jgi:hypothetical protein